MPTPLTDGSVIQLDDGWKLTLCARNEDCNYELQAFISKGRQSASLAFALETGTDSKEDLPIPRKILDAASLYSDYE